jgi:hypothetical protein
MKMEINMDSLFVIIKPIISSFLGLPEIAAFVVSIVTAILLYYKVPKWIVNVLVEVIRAAFHSAISVENEANADHEHSAKVWQSQDKLDAAKVRLTESMKQPKQKKLLAVLGGAERIIENIVIPVCQIFWKRK